MLYSQVLGHLIIFLITKLLQIYNNYLVGSHLDHSFWKIQSCYELPPQSKFLLPSSKIINIYSLGCDNFKIIWILLLLSLPYVSSTRSPLIALAYSFPYSQKVISNPLKVLVIKNVQNNTSKPRINQFNSTLVCLNTKIKRYRNRWRTFY